MNKSPNLNETRCSSSILIIIIIIIFVIIAVLIYLYSINSKNTGGDYMRFISEEAYNDKLLYSTRPTSNELSLIVNGSRFELNAEQADKNIHKIHLHIWNNYVDILNPYIADLKPDEETGDIIVGDIHSSFLNFFTPLVKAGFITSLNFKKCVGDVNLKFVENDAGGYSNSIIDVKFGSDQTQKVIYLGDILDHSAHGMDLALIEMFMLMSKLNLPAYWVYGNHDISLVLYIMFRKYIYIDTCFVNQEKTKRKKQKYVYSKIYDDPSLFGIHITPKYIKYEDYFGFNYDFKQRFIRHSRVSNYAKLFYMDPKFVASHSLITSVSNVNVYKNGIVVTLDGKRYFIDESGSVRLLINVIGRVKQDVDRMNKQVINDYIANPTRKLKEMLNIGKLIKLTNDLSPLFINSMYNNSNIKASNTLNYNHLTMYYAKGSVVCHSQVEMKVYEMNEGMDSTNLVYENGLCDDEVVDKVVSQKTCQMIEAEMEEKMKSQFSGLQPGSFGLKLNAQRFNPKKRNELKVDAPPFFKKKSSSNDLVEGGGREIEESICAQRFKPKKPIPEGASRSFTTYGNKSDDKTELQDLESMKSSNIYIPPIPKSVHESSGALGFTIESSTLTKPYYVGHYNILAVSEIKTSDINTLTKIFELTCKLSGNSVVFEKADKNMNASCILQNFIDSSIQYCDICGSSFLNDMLRLFSKYEFVSYRYANDPENPTIYYKVVDINSMFNGIYDYRVIDRSNQLYEQHRASDRQVGPYTYNSYCAELIKRLNKLFEKDRKYSGTVWRMQGQLDKDLKLIKRSSNQYPLKYLNVKQF